MPTLRERDYGYPAPAPCGIPSGFLDQHGPVLPVEELVEELGTDVEEFPKAFRGVFAKHLLKQLIRGSLLLRSGRREAVLTRRRCTWCALRRSFVVGWVVCPLLHRGSGCTQSLTLAELCKGRPHVI